MFPRENHMASYAIRVVERHKRAPSCFFNAGLVGLFHMPWESAKTFKGSGTDGNREHDAWRRGPLQGWAGLFRDLLQGPGSLLAPAQRRPPVIQSVRAAHFAREESETLVPIRAPV